MELDCFKAVLSTALEFLLTLGMSQILSHVAASAYTQGGRRLVQVSSFSTLNISRFTPTARREGETRAQVNNIME